MKVGTILRNMYQPSYESYFVFRNFSGNDALGIWVIITDKGEHHIQWSARFPKEHIQNDREHFPIVGQIDLKELVINHVLNEASRQKRIDNEQKTS